MPKPPPGNVGMVVVPVSPARDGPTPEVKPDRSGPVRPLPALDTALLSPERSDDEPPPPRLDSRPCTADSASVASVAVLVRSDMDTFGVLVFRPGTSSAGLAAPAAAHTVSMDESNWAPSAVIRAPEACWIATAAPAVSGLEIAARYAW